MPFRIVFEILWEWNLREIEENGKNVLEADLK